MLNVSSLIDDVIKQHGLRVSYVSLGLLSFILYGWCWSLLFHVLSLSHQDEMLFPWTAFHYLLQFSSHSPRENLLLIVTLMMPASLLGLMALSYQQQKRLNRLYGDAHWATLREIKHMGLLGKEGLIIGYKQGRLLQAPLTSHALVFAPSRSGKGVSQVMPNALTFPDSLLVVDIKQEIFRDTSGFRAQHGQKVYLFAPANPDGKTHCWNPLDVVDRDPYQCVPQLQLIATILIPHDPKGTSMWVEEARALLVGLLLWLMQSDRPFTLGELANLIKGTPYFDQFIQGILQPSLEEAGRTPLHPIAFRNLNNFSQKAMKEQSGVKSTLASHLNLWDDPWLNAATSCSDFDIRKMRQQRMTIYLGIPTNQLIRLAPLMNLFIQLFLQTMTAHLPTQEEPFRILVMLDEFCALGRMETLKQGFGFLAGYQIHLMAIIQTIGQFYDTYGGRDSCDVFFQNTDYKIAYRQNERTDQEFISHQLGTRTVKQHSRSYAANLLMRRQPSMTESVVARPLLTPEEIRTFPAEEGIAIVNGKPPIRYQRIIHYQDPAFQVRLLPPITIPTITPHYPTLPVSQPTEMNPDEIPLAD